MDYGGMDRSADGIRKAIPDIIETTKGHLQFKLRPLKHLPYLA